MQYLTPFRFIDIHRSCSLLRCLNLLQVLFLITAFRKCKDFLMSSKKVLEMNSCSYQSWHSSCPVHQSLPCPHTDTISFTRFLSVQGRSWGRSPPPCTPPSTNPSSCRLRHWCVSQTLTILGCLTAFPGSVQNLINYLMFTKHFEDERNYSINGKYHDYLLLWLSSLYPNREKLVAT